MEEEIKKTSIESLTDLRLLKFLQFDFSEGHFDKDRIIAQVQQIKLGLNYKRDVSMAKRIEKGQMLQIINMITTNPKEREKYIRNSMPKLLNAKK